MAMCPNTNKDDWCKAQCPHCNEHEENDACTQGVCPVTYRFLECVPKKTGLGKTCTLTEAVIKIAENTAIAMRRDDSHLKGVEND